MKTLEYFGTSLIEAGHCRSILQGNRMEKTWYKFDDLPFHPEYLTHNLPKGEVVFYQSAEYTVLAIAGSCKDERPGSKSVFWTKEILSKEEMVKRIMAEPIAVEIIAKMKFRVKWEVLQSTQSDLLTSDVRRTITDEEIKETSKEWERTTSYMDADAISFERGAKWMRSQLSQKASTAEVREELIKFASRNDKYDLTNIKNTEVSAYLEMLKKGHEEIVDEYLNSKEK